MKSYMEWIIRHRIAVMILTLLISGLAVYQAKNLRIVIDTNSMLPPSHPYIATGIEVAKVFGTKYIVAIGITPKQGDIYQPAVLEKVQRLTTTFTNTPGVIKTSVVSLSAKRAKKIVGSAEGMEVKALMASVPANAADMAALKAAVEKNPVYLSSVVSKDAKTTSIIVEFENDPTGYRAIMNKVDPIVQKERDSTVEINIGGAPNFLARIEVYSERMGFLLPIAILVLSLVLYEAFRSRQGPLLPLLTGIIAVIWSVGVMGASGTPMDVFNATTPILILAVATGHAVQMLKRYYEEYYRLRETSAMPPKEANIAAVISALVRVGPVMLIAGTVASLGFLSLIVMDISTVRTFGIFTGIGILATLILEMTFIPALRSLLSPPGDLDPQRKTKARVWDKLTGAIADLVVTGPGRRKVYIGMGLFVTVALVGMNQVRVDNSMKTYFGADQLVRTDDQALNDRLGGTNTVFVLIEGKDKDAIKNPKTLQAMDDVQRFIESQPNVGKTVSIVDFIKRMNQAMHADDPAFFAVPKDGDLVSQYLLLYSLSGEPGDFDTYVDYDYRKANITAFIKSDSSADFEKLAAKLKTFTATRFPKDVQIKIGGGLAEGAALSEVMVNGKILNIVQISAVVFIISCLIFRSLVAGMLVMLPLLLAILANFGLIGWTGIPLNISTSLISAMAVGIGADYAIYLIFRIREELENGTDELIAIRKVLMTAGQAILFVAIAVAGGYGVLLLSFGFHIHQWMAILIAAAMLVSAFGALLLIPALMLSFRPNFIFRRIAMKSNPASTAAIILALACGFSLPTHDASAAEPDLNAIMEKNATVFKVLDSVSDATFTLINKSGQERVRKTFSTTKLAANGIDNMRMTRFLSPADVKGTVSLLIEHADKDDDIWIYLPALKKVRRLVSSNKKDSFVGTDFSNADVIGYKVTEWQYKLLREETQDGQPCYVIEATPKTEMVKANTGYAKRVNWIRKDNLMTSKTDYWDESGQMVKTAIFGDIQAVDPKNGKWQALKLEASNTQTGHRTLIRVENFKVNQKVADEFFTTRYMEKE